METLVNCQHCSTPYHWHKSSSTLKLTYCGSICERSNLGFTIAGLTNLQLINSSDSEKLEHVPPDADILPGLDSRSVSLMDRILSEMANEERLHTVFDDPCNCWICKVRKDA